MERRLMNFYGWDINFLLPIHFLEMYLANGILFQTEYKHTIEKSQKTA
jgi:hypothetical protein